MITNCYNIVYDATITLERPGGSNGPPIGFTDLNFEAFKQTKWNFQYL